MKTRSGSHRASVFALSAFAALTAASSVRSQDVELRAELVYTFTGALFPSANEQKPIEVVAPPGDTERLFVALQRGRIFILNLADDSLIETPFLDIRNRIACCGERGLLGLAFHPNYAENGFFYVYYTSGAGPGDLVIARYERMAGEANRADPNSEEPLLVIPHSLAGNHNGGKLAFGPKDGYLYAFTGDGGGGCDSTELDGQEEDSLLGKVLRLDVDSGDPYGIPASNPFLSPGDGVRDEIWAVGLRNPWRCAFDSETGDLYIADVGQNVWEEINIQLASSPGGENYEWNVREADHGSGCNPISTYGPGTRREPVLEYPHTGAAGTMFGRSITGGEVYRGTLMPELQGTYFFADHEVHWVRSFRADGGIVSDLQDRTAELNMGLVADVLDNITGFGADGRGELYIIDQDTKLFRIVPAVQIPNQFRRSNANADVAIDISDGVYTLLFLFATGEAPVCDDAADANDDGVIDIADPVYGFGALFTGGPAPPEPYVNCGTDPTAEDTLDCVTSTCQ